MSYLNEDEADAFFHDGDAGTYDGGPALSLAPVGMADLIEDNDDAARRPPSAEQLARRERLKRLVTTVVSTLAVGSALVFAFRITRTETGTASAASLTADDGRMAAPSTAIAEEYRAARAAAAVAHAVAEAPPVVPMLEAAHETPASKPAPVAHVDLEAVKAIVPSPPAVHGALPSPAKRSPAQASERAPVREAHVSAVRSPAATTGRSPSTSGHAPPTANFPD